MTRFGTTLYKIFIEQAWPMTADEPMELVTWADVVKLFFESAGPVRAKAADFEFMWNASGVKELDAVLKEMAQTGEFALVRIQLGPAALAELWRRWQYAIIGAELERLQGEELNIPIPRDAPPELKGAAVMLYILGGPARAYRKDLHMKTKIRQQKGATQRARGALAQALTKQSKKPRT